MKSQPRWTSSTLKLLDQTCAIHGKINTNQPVRAVDCNSIHSKQTKLSATVGDVVPFLFPPRNHLFFFSGEQLERAQATAGSVSNQSEQRPIKKIKFCLLQLLPPTLPPRTRLVRTRSDEPLPRNRPPIGSSRGLQRGYLVLRPRPLLLLHTDEGRAGCCCCYARAPLRRSGTKLRPGAH